MSTNNLSMSWGPYTLQTVEGNVKESNMWSETHTRSTGSGKKQRIHTNVVNKVDFWMETKDGKERHYTANSDNVKLRQDQEVIVLEAHHKGKSKYHEAILVLNKKQDTVFTNIGAWGLAYDERPNLYAFLILFICFGWLGLMGGNGTWGFIYTCTTLGTATYYLYKVAYYGRKLKDARKTLLNLL